MGFHGQVSVDDTAAALPGTEHYGWVITNLGPDPCYMGADDGVTDATGFPLPVDGIFAPGQLSQESMRGAVGDRIWAICATGDSSDVRIFVPGRLSF